MKDSKKIRVLYANDNQEDCIMLSILLGNQDIEVFTANTVTEAWRLAQNEHFDFYLLDVRFAQCDGLPLCRKLREFAPHTSILLTQMNQIIQKSWRQGLMPDYEKAIEEDLNYLIEKPNDFNSVKMVFN
jgi:response regulator RpfG family c-di-GMP phosphodiesterase